jgi:hypothetical protein
MASTPSSSPEYLAESRVTLLNAFYALPIPLEILSTALRLWASRRPGKQGRLAFDDYLMIWATVCRPLGNDVLVQENSVISSSHALLRLQRLRCALLVSYMAPPTVSAATYRRCLEKT